MVVRYVKGHGYAVFSKKTGKRLSRFYRYRSQAVRRLRQIEFFKSGRPRY